MNRMKAVISYEGTQFSGYQIQPNGRTVQGVLEAALTKMHKGRHVRVAASGRTDADVHARGQVLHFDSDLQIPDEGWKKGLNANLPDDVVVLSVEKVNPAFHARFDVVKKEYRYRVLRTTEPDVFKRRYTYHHSRPIDVEALRAAAEMLVGTHDFSSFCAANTDVKHKVRTIHEIDIFEEGDEVIFRFTGSGFLYQMVRILVGTLLEVGRGERSCTEIKTILYARDRKEAGVTAPGCGLTLWKVTY